MSDTMRICAEINLSAIEENLRYLHAQTEGKADLLAVVKADAYGHGAVVVSQYIEDLPFIAGFAVATADEGVELRRHGIKKPIQLLSYSFPESYPSIVEYDLTACLFDKAAAQDLSDFANNKNTKVSVHLAVDTGMHRIGFRDDEDAIREISEIANLPGLSIDGLFTHFARADEEDLSATEAQYERFLAFADALQAQGLTIPTLHCANSAAILQFSKGHQTLVRPGIAMYGIAPSEETEGLSAPLQGAMTLISHVTFVKEIEAGDAVSYGGHFVADKRMRIATIPVGYADGYPRSLSNKGYVLIRGQKAPILGRVCMDQFMVDVDHIAGVARGDAVLLLGENEDGAITAEELGKTSGRFPYELVCDISKRVPRVYVGASKNG